MDLSVALLIWFQSSNSLARGLSLCHGSPACCAPGLGTRTGRRTRPANWGCKSPASATRPRPPPTATPTWSWPAPPGRLPPPDPRGPGYQSPSPPPPPAPSCPRSWARLSRDSGRGDRAHSAGSYHRLCWRHSCRLHLFSCRYYWFLW